MPRALRLPLMPTLVLVLALAGARLAGAAAPLADAAERAAWPEVQSMLDRRANVNATQVDGMTALHWAVHHDTEGMTARLLRAGADPRASNRYGITPLALACTNGNAAIVGLLLQAGADANASLPGGESALMTAARSGAVQVVQALLAHGARVEARDDRRAQTALMWAAAEGHAAVVEVLIAAGADVRTQVGSGLTPLLFAVREGHLEVTRLLVRAGADVNAAIAPDGPGPRRRGYGGGVPPAGTTPLLLAVRNAHFDVAAALLDAGADPNAERTGYTALHAISVVRRPGVGDNDPAPAGSGEMTSLEFAKVLLARGANPNARMTRRTNLNNSRLNESGATPFLLAALTADVPLMTALVAGGADPTLTNADGSTALMIAAGLATRSPGEDAGTEAETVDAVRFLLDLGADIDAVDRNGETAMHAAAYKNLPGVVRLLAARGARADVWNRPDRFEWTPLAIAAGYRFGNFKPSPETEAAIREVMIAAGITPPAVVVAKTQQIY